MRLEHSFAIPVPVEQAWPILLDIERIAPCMPGAAVNSVTGDEFTGSVKVKLGPINLTYKGEAKFTEKNHETHTAIIDARGRDSRGNGTAAAVITAALVGDGDSTTVNVATDLNITGKPAQFGRGVMADVGNKLIGQFADCLASKLAQSDADYAAEGAAANAESSAQAAGADSAQAAAADSADGRHALIDEATSQTAQAASESTGAVSPSADEAVKPVPATSAPVKAAPRPASAAKPAAEPEPIDLLELAGGSVAKRAIPVLGGLVALILLILFIKKRSS